MGEDKFCYDTENEVKTCFRHEIKEKVKIPCSRGPKRHGSKVGG